MFVISFIFFVLLGIVSVGGQCPDTTPKGYYSQRDNEVGSGTAIEDSFTSPIVIPNAFESYGLPVDDSGNPNLCPCQLYDLQDYCVARINWYRKENPAFPNGKTRDRSDKQARPLKLG